MYAVDGGHVEAAEQVLAAHSRAEGKFDAAVAQQLHTDAGTEQQVFVVSAEYHLRAAVVLVDCLAQDRKAVGEQIALVWRQQRRDRATER